MQTRTNYLRKTAVHLVSRPAFLKLWYTYHWWYNCNCQVVQLKAGRKLNFFTSQGKKVKWLPKEEEFRNSTIHYLYLTLYLLILCLIIHCDNI